MKNFNILLIILFLFTSCGGGLKDVGKVLRNEKVRTTDEFLVKKRNPLVLPPGLEEIPAPGTINQNKEESGKDKIKKILKAPNIDDVSKKKSSSVEQSILDRIRE